MDLTEPLIPYKGLKYLLLKKKEVSLIVDFSCTGKPLLCPVSSPHPCLCPADLALALLEDGEALTDRRPYFCHLIISQEARLLGVLSWRCRSHGFSLQSILRGSEEAKGTPIGGEAHEELLWGCPQLSPVIHGIRLQVERIQTPPCY